MVRLFILAAVFSMGSPPAFAQSTDARFGSATRITASTGEGIYADLCQGCHMAGGAGATGAGAYPALALNPKLASADYLLAMVIHGRKGMPPLGGLLNDEQVAAVSNFVRSHFGNAVSGRCDGASGQSRTAVSSGGWGRTFRAQIKGLPHICPAGPAS